MYIRARLKITVNQVCGLFVCFLGTVPEKSPINTPPLNVPTAMILCDNVSPETATSSVLIANMRKLT